MGKHGNGVPTDCAIIVGGHSSGALYAREFHSRNIVPIHVPAGPQPPSTYAAQKLASEFRFDLPYVEDIDTTIKMLHTEPLRAFRPRCVVAGTDHGVARADLLAERLNLPSNGSALSALRRNKFHTVERLRACGLNAALQFCVRDPVAAGDAVRRHPEICRWVVKPTQSAASDRVALCSTAGEVVAAAQRVIDGTNAFGERDLEAVVQEYLGCSEDPHEYVVNSCSMSDPVTGRVVHRIVSIYRYEKISVNGAPFVYYARNLLPYDGSVQRQLIKYFVACLDALEIRQGPCHGELRITSRGPSLVEANVGRPDGGGVPKLDMKCTGTDQVTLNVESLINPEKYRGRFNAPYSLLQQGRAAFFISRHRGVLRKISGLSRLRALPSFVEAYFLAEVGKPVVPTVDVTTLLGWAFQPTPTDKLSTLIIGLYESWRSETFLRSKLSLARA